ncbi:MAG TPA: response regulator [Candidatus Brocadiia bacterium]|nr:response regulator [Candidatus Brocadiales bacterium]
MQKGDKLSCSKVLKTKILVIDDDINICWVLEREFELDGSFDALSIQNAFMAGAKLEEFKPDIVLLDTHLDGIDGRDVCKFLKQNAEFKDIKIIGMSGIYLQEEITGQDGNGFDAFLKKPFKFSELKKKIHKLLKYHN